MALTSIPLVGADVTSITCSDGTTPTALTMPWKPTDDTVVTLMLGKKSTVFPMGPNGLPESDGVLRPTGVEELCGFTISGVLRDVGDNSTDENLLDLLTWDGYIAANWLSTTDCLTSEAADAATFDWTMVFADRTNTAGTVRGATWVFPNCRHVGPPSVQVARNGWQISQEFRSTTAVHPTKTRTT